MLLASVRPWRYLVSSAFRGKIDAQFAGKNPVFKWWHMLWGSVLLTASLAVVVGFAWFLFHMHTDTRLAPSLRQQAAEKGEQVIIEHLKQRSRSKQ